MQLIPIQTTSTVLDIYSDMSVLPRERRPGAPERVAGMTVGMVSMQACDQSPHDGEMRPDGDEILLVSTGRIRVSYDSGAEPLELRAGQACIIPAGEWHKIDCLEDSHFVHITPGPNGEARFG